MTSSKSTYDVIDAEMCRPPSKNEAEEISSADFLLDSFTFHAFDTLMFKSHPVISRPFRERQKVK